MQQPVHRQALQVRDVGFMRGAERPIAQPHLGQRKRPQLRRDFLAMKFDRPGKRITGEPRHGIAHDIGAGGRRGSLRRARGPLRGRPARTADQGRYGKNRRNQPAAYACARCHHFSPILFCLSLTGIREVARCPVRAELGISSARMARRVSGAEPELPHVRRDADGVSTLAPCSGKAALPTFAKRPAAVSTSAFLSN